MFRVSIVFTLFIIPNLLFSQNKADLIHFTPEGKEVAIPYFKEGLLLLHSFEYEEAVEKFKTAQLMDPDFVMAYWGEAMCYNRPLQNQQEVNKGRAALLKLGLFPEDRIAMAQNDLEKGFITSVEKLYEEGEIAPNRNENYHKTLEALQSKFPDHEEVLSFYALALLSKACNEVEALNKAAAECEKVLAKNPTHPGALHYLILAYDTPLKAEKGLKTANEYAKIAPETEHAQHIPSHIYAGLGLWDQSANANKKSWELTEAKVKKNKLSLEDRAYHSLWWLEFSKLQKGKYDASEQMVKDMYQDARLSKSKETRFHAIVMRTSYVIESEDWASSVNNYDIPTSEIHILVKANNYLAKGLKAYHENDGRKLEWIIGQIEDLRTMEKTSLSRNANPTNCSLSDLMNSTTTEQDLQLVEAMELELRALLALSISDNESAIENIKKASQIEASSPLKTGPPLIAKPANELYGEILLALNNHQEALEKFNETLSIYPNRTRALIGKYKALKALGNQSEASKTKASIMKNWKEADQGLAASL